MSEWISVKDRLPEPAQWFVAAETIRVREFESGDIITATILTRGYPGAVVHKDAQWWFPLPDPPKDDE